MRELRLLPAALLSWLVVLSVILTRGPWVALVLIILVAIIAAVLKHIGQVVLLGAVGMATGLVTWQRVQIAQHYEFPEQIVGTVEYTKVIDGGGR